jgi:uncharacterized membrane protein
MTKNRLEAFSDGVIAILITIMVLEIHPPTGFEIESLRPVLPVILNYLLSFAFLGIYWNNHHHMIHSAKHISGGVLWANMHLLFWLSLIPIGTAWVGQQGFKSVPVAAYGVILLFAGVAYFILAQCLVKVNGTDSELAQAIGKDFKGKLSIVLYVAAVGCAFWIPVVATAIYIGVALMWLVPDRRFEGR